MDWSLSTLWWIAAGVLVAAELGTGTFYLLMLALGAAAGALAAHAGLGSNAQLLVAALVGGAAVTAWRLKRQRSQPAPPAAENRDVNIDIGEQVDITEWQADGSASAMYRGAHVIRSVEGNRLHVERKDNP